MSCSSLCQVPGHSGKCYFIQFENWTSTFKCSWFSSHFMAGFKMFGCTSFSNVESSLTNTFLLNFLGYEFAWHLFGMLFETISPSVWISAHEEVGLPDRKTSVQHLTHWLLHQVQKSNFWHYYCLTIHRGIYFSVLSEQKHFIKPPWFLCMLAVPLICRKVQNGH